MPGPQSFDLSRNYFLGVELEAELGEANYVVAAVVDGFVVVDAADDIAAVVVVSVDGTAVAEDDIVAVVQIVSAADTVVAVEEKAALAVL